MSPTYPVLIRPVVSEKTYKQMETGVYVFVVDPRATKIQIREAVEATFNVNVAKVNTMSRKGKRKRSRSSAIFGHRPDTKRAVVSLAGDDRIDLFERA